MRETFSEIVENGRIRAGKMATNPGDPYGAFILRYLRTMMRLHVIIGSDFGWDHVSVSVLNKKKRCPTWDEMCWIKHLFFKDDEWAMQLHPPPNKNINIHPFVLHLWRPQEGEIITPPRECV